MPTFKYNDGIELSKEELAKIIQPHSHKLYWFLERGYNPHYWQTLFHTLSNPQTNRLCRFRHLVAGRRGGKTLGVAWDILYYVQNPWAFHLAVHGKEDDRPLRGWGLAQDYTIGFESLLAFREVCNQAGLKQGVDFSEHKGNKWFEFANGCLVQFKSADEPQKLRGAGLDFLWMDEAAFIVSIDAYDVVRPALSDRMGIVIGSTTPSGKNWYYETFWGDQALLDPSIGRVEYTSIHNPYFPQEEWDYARRTYHPMLFKQEYMAAFDSMAGRELHGDWLKYYSSKDLPTKEGSDHFKGKVYIGIDPAISLSDKADRFSIAAVGVTDDNEQAYLLEIYTDHVPFPEQLRLIGEWHAKYRPQLIGIESNAYQAALAQQALRLPNLPPVVPMLSKGHKSERILSMAPLFKIGRVKIRSDHRDFIEEWVDYDSTLKNPKDDTLDAVEIALRTAGALLPSTIPVETFEPPATDVISLAKRDLPKTLSELDDQADPHVGEW